MFEQGPERVFYIGLEGLGLDRDHLLPSGSLVA